MAQKNPAKTADIKGGKATWMIRNCVQCSNEIAQMKDSLRVLRRDYTSTRFSDRWTWWHRNCWGK
jgi:hypothetical protein